MIFSSLFSSYLDSSSDSKAPLERELFYNLLLRKMDAKDRALYEADAINSLSKKLKGQNPSWLERILFDNIEFYFLFKSNGDKTPQELIKIFLKYSDSIKGPLKERTEEDILRFLEELPNYDQYIDEDLFRKIYKLLLNKFIESASNLKTIQEKPERTEDLKESFQKAKERILNFINLNSENEAIATFPKIMDQNVSAEYFHTNEEYILRKMFKSPPPS